MKNFFLRSRALQSSQIRTNYRSEFSQCLEPWIGQTAVNQHLAELAGQYLNKLYLIESSLLCFRSKASSRMYESTPQPPATKKQQTAMKNKLLEGDTSFSTHCRAFESQLRELNQQFNTVKDRVTDLHRDITALRKAQIPPITSRYGLLTRDCAMLDQNLERQQQELDRMAVVFDASWEDQLWRLRVEQEVFSCQRADVMTLRNELKHLSNLAAQLEPYIVTLTLAQQHQMPPEQAAEQAQHLQSLIEHIGKFDEFIGCCPEFCAL